jgi:hypothetical protein
MYEKTCITLVYICYETRVRISTGPRITIDFKHNINYLELKSISQERVITFYIQILIG